MDLSCSWSLTEMGLSNFVVFHGRVWPLSGYFLCICLFIVSLRSGWTKKNAPRANSIWFGFDLVLDKKPINGINLYLLEQPPPGEHSTCSYWHELRTEKGKVGPLKKKQTNPAISQDWEVETGQWLLWSDCKPGGMINWVVGIQGLGS